MKNKLQHGFLTSDNSVLCHLFLAALRAIARNSPRLLSQCILLKPPRNYFRTRKFLTCFWCLANQPTLLKPPRNYFGTRKFLTCFWCLANQPTLLKPPRNNFGTRKFLTCFWCLANQPTLLKPPRNYFGTRKTTFFLKPLPHSK